MNRRGALVPVGWAVVALAVVAVVPGWSRTLVEVTVLAVAGLSLDVVLRRLAGAALFQPGLVAFAAWLTAGMLARNQSPVIALVVAALLSGALAALVAAGGRAGAAGMTVGGLGLAVLLTAVVPPSAGYAPPVFLGVSLATPRAAVVLALAALFLAWWLHESVLHDEFGRWLHALRDAPDLVARAGVSIAGVRTAGLGLAGVLAGVAGWAASLGTLGAPGMGTVDPVVGFVWVLIPLVGGRGVTGALAGAAVFTGAARVATAMDVPALALVAPLTLILVWREAAR